MIARHHRDAQSFLVKLANGVGCRVLDRIRHAEESGDPAVNGDKHHGLPLALESLGFLRQRAGRDAELLHQSAIPERDILSIDASTHALPGERFKGVGLDGLRASLFGPAHDGCGERMFAPAFEGGSQSEHPGRLHSVRGSHRSQHWLAVCQSSGLVHDEGIDSPQDLDGFRILEQDTCCRSLAGCDHDRHRRCQTEGTGAGDDEHRDSVDDRVRHSWLGAHPRPDTERQNRNRDHCRYKVSGDDIHELLNRRPAALSLCDQLYDPGRAAYRRPHVRRG